MKLIVGLGNPGPQYHDTRHNVGFVVLDSIARRHAPGEIARGRFAGAVLEAAIGSEKVLLLKPATFMNRSGQSVREAVSFYKLDPVRDLLVLVDDVALLCGTLRLRAEGSAGGHNGLADIEQQLATPAYPRLRIGIDSPGSIPQKDYVLGRFRPDQQAMLEPALEHAAQAAECWVLNGIDQAMNRYNTRTLADNVA